MKIKKQHVKKSSIKFNEVKNTNTYSLLSNTNIKLFILCSILLPFFGSCDFNSKTTQNQVFDIETYKIKASSKEDFFIEASNFLSNVSPEEKTKFEQGYLKLMQTTSEATMSKYLDGEIKTVDQLDQMTQSERDAYGEKVDTYEKKANEIWLATIRRMTIKEVIYYGR